MYPLERGKGEQPGTERCRRQIVQSIVPRSSMYPDLQRMVSFVKDGCVYRILL